MLYMSNHDQYNIYCERYIIIANSTVELYIIMHYSISDCHLLYNYGYFKPTYNNACIICLFLQYESDCPGYPTERYTVDIDGVQVANMTADELESLTTIHTNRSVTLSLPLTQRLSEEAVTVNMTKLNTVPTNMSDDMGNTVTKMVTWGTSAVFNELAEIDESMH